MESDTSPHTSSETGTGFDHTPQARERRRIWGVCLPHHRCGVTVAGAAIATSMAASGTAPGVPQPGKRRYGSRAPALERTSSAHIDGWRRCGSFVGVPRCNHHTGCPMAPGRTGLLRSVHPTLHPPLLLPHPRLKPHVWDRRSLSAFSKGSSSIRSALIPHPPPPPSTPCPPNRPEGSHISTSTPSTSASMPTCLLLL